MITLLDTKIQEYLSTCSACDLFQLVQGVLSFHICQAQSRGHFVINVCLSSFLSTFWTSWNAAKPNSFREFKCYLNTVCVYFPACRVWRSTRKSRDAVELGIKLPLWLSHSLMKWLFLMVSIFFTLSSDWKTEINEKKTSNSTTKKTSSALIHFQSWLHYLSATCQIL